MKNIKLYLGILLLTVGFFDLNPSKLIDIIPTPDPVVIIDDKPSDDILNKVSPVAALITDKQDQESCAIFFHTFSQRLLMDQYKDVKLQQVNDIIVEAGKEYFGDSLKGKYAGLSIALEELVKNTVGPDDIYLESHNLQDLSDVFVGLSWKLLN